MALVGARAGEQVFRYDQTQSLAGTAEAGADFGQRIVNLAVSMKGTDRNLLSGRCAVQCGRVKSNFLSIGRAGGGVITHSEFGAGGMNFFRPPASGIWNLCHPVKTRRAFDGIVLADLRAVTYNQITDRRPCSGIQVRP